ncbi:MAG: GAF domain-containing protein [Chloroflexi bacterium]|nr:GAF domain-containing protein [Chloroflexota bacterium]MBU1749363.1 GAF domain-containing protein [Chloroflexota bacterium]
MIDREAWQVVLKQPRGWLVVVLAAAGAIAAIILAVRLWPALEAALIAGLAVLGWLIAALGLLWGQAMIWRQQKLDQKLRAERHRAENVQEQSQKLLHLQEQTMLYAQDLNDAVQRERLRMDELDSIQQVAMAVLSELTLESVLGLISEAVATLTQADTASVSLLTVDNRMRTHVAAYGLTASVLQGTSSPADTALHGWVIKSGDALLVDNLRDTDWRRGHGAVRRDGQKTAVVAPLKVRGQVIGCLSAFDKRHGQPFDEHDLQLLTLFANQAAIAIENARLYEQVRQDLTAQSELVGQVQRRVRESLALVQDLLAVAEREPYAQTAVRQVQIIAQVYDLLAQHDFSSLTFAELAESIAGLVYTDLDTDAQVPIELTIHDDEVWLSPGQVTPLALTVCEVVRELARDARPAAGRIELRARLTEEPERRIMVQVRGFGLAPQLSKTGQRAVQSLVEKNLLGHIHTSTEGEPATVLIQFPIEAQRPSLPLLEGIPLDGEIAPPPFLRDA